MMYRPQVIWSGWKPRTFFVCGFDAVSFRGLVVVHDHGDDIQFDHFRLGNIESPEKQVLQQTTEKVGSLCKKGLVEPLDCMRRGHVIDVSFDGGCVAGVFGQDIEVGQVSTGAVEEEAENLLEKLIDGRAFGVLAHGAEKAVDVGEKANATKVASKEVEPGRLVRQSFVT